MRILVLAPYSRPWDESDAEGSGMNIFIRESCEALVAAGHTVDVCIRKSRPGDQEVFKIRKGLNVHSLKAGLVGKLSRHEVYNALQKSGFSDDLVDRADLVIAHYWISAPWIKAVSGKYHGRILYFSHSHFLNPYREQVDSLHQKAEIGLLGRVTWCAYSSEEFESLSDILPEGRLAMTHPGVENVVGFGDLERTNEVLFVGRKNHAKGYDLFCAVANRFPYLSFVAIGRDEVGDDINTEHVISEDFLELSKLQRRISAARLVVCPSRYEHFGLIPLLALSVGTPVVATNRGGFKDVIISESTGVLCESNVESIANAINLALDKLPIPAQDTKAKEILNKYSWNNWVREIQAVATQTDNLLQTKFLEVSVTPHKTNGAVVWYEKVKLPGSVHVIPVNEDGTYEFIEEDRYDEGVSGKLRVLSGIIEKGESPDQAAIRELKEEIGWETERLVLIWHSMTKGTVEDQRYYFLAENSKKGASIPDTTERIVDTRSIAKEELLKLVQQGVFGESFTAVALLKLCGIL